MKRLKFAYSMLIRFSNEVEGHHFTLRFLPSSDTGQRIENLSYKIEPCEYLSEGHDSFGNRYLFGHTEKRHSFFSAQAQGTAVTGLPEDQVQAQGTNVTGLSDYRTQVQGTNVTGLSDYRTQAQGTNVTGLSDYRTQAQGTNVTGLSDYRTEPPGSGQFPVSAEIRKIDPESTFSLTEGWIKAKPSVTPAAGTIADYERIFRCQTPWTRQGAELHAFTASFNLCNSLTPSQKAEEIMHRVHDKLVYDKTLTDANTDAESAIHLSGGVCQDYAQIMISVCRALGIPARYATGMLIGEGESHAWVEICDSGRWTGFDPTNDVNVTDSYIRISAGRDHSDCSINRGIFRLLTPGTIQTQTVSVSVRELPAQFVPGYP